MTPLARRRVIRLGGILAVLIGLALALRSFIMLDRYVIYFPEPLLDKDWAQASGLPIENVWLTTTDGVKLHGWFIPAKKSRATFLWCHGNAGNISHRLELIRPLIERGISVMIFDYRGYGKSGGQPSEAGLYADGEAAYSYVVGERAIPAEQVFLFGESLGTAVVTALMHAHSRAAGLILVSPFPSVIAVVRYLYGGLPVHYLVQARFDTIARLSHIHKPVLVLHGDRDSVIPLELGKTVFTAANEPKTFVVIPRADHNDIYSVGGRAFYDAIDAFVTKTLSP